MTQPKQGLRNLSLRRTAARGTCRNGPRPRHFAPSLIVKWQTKKRAVWTQSPFILLYENKNFILKIFLCTSKKMKCAKLNTFDVYNTRFWKNSTLQWVGNICWRAECCPVCQSNISLIGSKLPSHEANLNCNSLKGRGRGYGKHFLRELEWLIWKSMNFFLKVSILKYYPIAIVS